MLAVNTDKDREISDVCVHVHVEIHTLAHAHSIKDPRLCLTLRAQQGSFLFSVWGSDRSRTKRRLTRREPSVSFLRR